MSDSLPTAHVINRLFLTVAGRQMHLRWVGDGPPALFVHSSPTNGSYVVPNMLAQADVNRCFAFDTPGFGLSDPLPLSIMRVADLADALAAAMEVAGLPACPVYGTHSGAAIALELAFRHPEKVTGLVLDGVPIFTEEETRPLRDSYFAPLTIDPQGGHFSATWTRFRDQSVWFPWNRREPDRLNDVNLQPAEVTHAWCEMFFAAARYYKPAYLASVSYGQEAVRAAAGLRAPAIFTAVSTDMLHPHLARLPRLRPDQAIVEIGRAGAGKLRLTRDGFARFGATAPGPEPAPKVTACGAVRRQIVMIDGSPVHLRYLGDPAEHALLLVHDAPGSAAMLEDEMPGHAVGCFVVAPDIPGSGESAPLPPGAGLDDYAGVLWRALAAIGIACAELRGVGFGASLAIAMAGDRRCSALTIDGLLAPAPDERADLLARYAPPITICEDGSHWYRTWLMIRDSQIWWPWYDRRHTALLRSAESFDAERLHLRTTETMKQHAAYGHFIHAVLRHDAPAALAALSVPVTVAATGRASPIAHRYAPAETSSGA